MNNHKSYPQSTRFEFYCYRNSLNMDENRKKKRALGKDESALDWLAKNYDEITFDEYNQLFVVEKHGKLNFIFENDLYFFFELDLPVHVVYDFCHLYPGFAVVRKGNRIGSIFFNEGISEPDSYRTVDIFEVKRDGFFGVETAKGDTLLACTYRFVKIYPEFILTLSNEGYSLFRPDGSKLFRGNYFSDVCLTKMRNKFVYVQKDERWGVVHVAGHWCVPAFFENKDDISWMNISFFCCTINGKKGLYNEQGKLIIPFEYDEIDYGMGWRAHPFLVTQNGKEGLIDCKGNIVFPCIYDEITCIGHHYRVWKDGKDSLWDVSNLYDACESKPLQETETSCQLIDSSCFDFFKNPWFFEEIWYEYRRHTYDDRTYKINIKEAKRWWSMYRVIDDEFFEDDEDFEDDADMENDEDLDVFNAADEKPDDQATLSNAATEYDTLPF